jgi:hypothetical protein
LAVSELPGKDRNLAALRADDKAADLGGLIIAHQTRQAGDVGGQQVISPRPGLVAEESCQVALRVQVHQENLLPGQGQGSGQVYGGGGLTRAAFLVCDCDDFHGLRILLAKIF